MHLCSQSSRWFAVLYKPELSWAEEEWESRSLLVFAQLGAGSGSTRGWQQLVQSEIERACSNQEHQHEHLISLITDVLGGMSTWYFSSQALTAEKTA